MPLVRVLSCASAVVLRVLRYLAHGTVILGLGLHGRRTPQDEPGPVPPALPQPAIPEPTLPGRLTPDELLWQAELDGIDQ